MLDNVTPTVPIFWTTIIAIISIIIMTAGTIALHRKSNTPGYSDKIIDAPVIAIFLGFAVLAGTAQFALGLYFQREDNITQAIHDHIDNEYGITIHTRENDPDINTILNGDTIPIVSEHNRTLYENTYKITYDPTNDNAVLTIADPENTENAPDPEELRTRTRS